MDGKLRELQLTQLEILEYVDLFCKENNIKYSLYAGTLLGAVRHKGFIPWDDDLDICMLRDDYNKFIELWNKKEHNEYLLQNKDNTPNFTQSFTKIRKKNTNFLQQDDLDRDYHTGIFIDVFPVDRIPNSSVDIKKYYFKCMLYQLMCREFVPYKNGFLTRLVCNLILVLTSKNMRIKIRGVLLNSLISDNNNKSLKLVLNETVRSMKKHYPSNSFDELIELEFEDRKFMCVNNWNEVLKIEYGDYLKLPPEETRMWQHKPVIIDFKKGPVGYE